MGFTLCSEGRKTCTSLCPKFAFYPVMCYVQHSLLSFVYNDSSCAADNTVELIAWVWEAYFHYKITKSLLNMLAFLKK